MQTLSDLVRKLFSDSGELVKNARLSHAEWIWLQRVRDLYSLVDDLDNSIERPKECLVEVCIAVESLFPNFHNSEDDFVVKYGVEAKVLVTSICQIVIGSHPTKGNATRAR